MGCLCAEELWNPTSGHLLVSEQNNLMNAFEATPGRTGWLVVVNINDRRGPVSRAEVEAWVRSYEDVRGAGRRPAESGVSRGVAQKNPR
jgi:hypothetical protein